MPQPAARKSDPVTGTDIHLVLVPSPTGAVSMPMQHPFSGQITGGVSTDVLINGFGAATQGSTATNVPPHVPIGGPSFARPPSNSGRVVTGSPTVLVNSRPLARAGDPVATCNDPVDATTATIASGSTNVVVA